MAGMGTEMSVPGASEISDQLIPSVLTLASGVTMPAVAEEWINAVFETYGHSAR